MPVELPGEHRSSDPLFLPGMREGITGTFLPMSTAFVHI